VQTDPDELCDLGADPAFAKERAQMEQHFFDWSRRLSQRTTRSDAWIAERDTVLGEAKAGILIGYRTEAELREAFAEGQPENKAPQKAS